MPKSPKPSRSRKPPQPQNVWPLGPLTECALIANRTVDQATARAIAAAARGDLGAQRSLLQASINYLKDEANEGTLAFLIQFEAVILARFCASQGDESDLKHLAGALSNLAITLREAGAVQLGDALMAEALSTMDWLASRGDDESAEIAMELAELQPPRVREAADIINQLGSRVAEPWQTSTSLQ